MENFFNLMLAGLLSGAVISAVLGVVFLRRTKQIEAEIKSQYDRNLTIFQSNRFWKEQSVSELLGPINIQLERTFRAFRRWNNQNLFLEAKVIMQGNMVIRDLLLTKSHLIPSELQEDAGKLIEHYDIWLEEYDRLRNAIKPDLETPFVFVGQKGFPFPKDSEQLFKEKYKEMRSDLYGNDKLG